MIATQAQEGQPSIQYLTLPLAELGVWMPISFLSESSRQLQQEITPDEAFSFWAAVFNWRNPANSPQVKEQRLNRVRTLCANLQKLNVYMDDLKIYIQIVELERDWYHKNKDVAFRFFRQLQMRVEQRGAKWEVISYGRAQSPSKAFHW